MNYESMSLAEVPHARNGKHRDLVNRILNDLGCLEEGRALKIPLQDLTESKEKVRSALNRETRKRGMKVSTAADTKFLYIWESTESEARKEMA